MVTPGFTVHEVIHALRCDASFLLKGVDGTVYVSKKSVLDEGKDGLLSLCQIYAKDNPMCIIQIPQREIVELERIPRLGEAYTEQDAINVLMFYLNLLTPKSKWSVNGRKIASDSPFAESFVVYCPDFAKGRNHGVTALTFGFSKDYFLGSLDESIKAAVLGFYDDLVLLQF